MSFLATLPTDLTSSQVNNLNLTPGVINSTNASVWSQVGGFISDLSNVGLNIYKAVNVPQVSAPKSTLPQGSVNTSGSLFGGSFGSVLVILAIVFGGIFALKAIRK